MISFRVSNNGDGTYRVNPNGEIAKVDYLGKAFYVDGVFYIPIRVKVDTVCDKGVLAVVPPLVDVYYKLDGSGKGWGISWASPRGNVLYLSGVSVLWDDGTFEVYKGFEFLWGKPQRAGKFGKFSWKTLPNVGGVFLEVYRDGIPIGGGEFDNELDLWDQVKNDIEHIKEV